MTNLFLNIDAGSVDWARAQFALTAIYHWLFVPLTLGLAVIMGIAETCWYRTRDTFWRDCAKFWQKLFGINFAMGVARYRGILHGIDIRSRHVLRMEEGIAGIPSRFHVADWLRRHHLSMVDSGGQRLDAVSCGLRVQS